MRNGLFFNLNECEVAAVIVNGNEIILQKEISIKEFLQKNGYNVQRVAVEKNGKIVPRINFETEMLLNTDKIEVVCFVGGG